MLGLLLGVGFGAFLEYRDTSLRSEDEIVRTLVLPVLAAIPIMTAVADRGRRKRRIVAASVAATVLTIAGLAAASSVASRHAQGDALMYEASTAFASGRSS